MEIRLKRAYAPPSPEDGMRVLVDRLWPRGVTKESLALDEWAKDVAPSTELRKAWHGDPLAHEPDRFAAFAASYRDELAQDPARSALAELAGRVKFAGRPLTLVFGAKDLAHNHVVVLRDALRLLLSEPPS